MTSYIWRTRLDGVVEVSVDGREFHIPRLTTPRLLAALGRTRARWERIVAPIAEEHQVPLAWVVAVIACESGGAPSVVSKAGAVGLMQLMPTTAGLTREQLLDPITNLRAGCRELARLRAALAQPDLPSVASGYNAGFNPKPRAPWPNEQSAERVRTPWAFRGEPMYIDSVVAASNEYTLRAAGHVPSGDPCDEPPLVASDDPATTASAPYAEPGPMLPPAEDPGPSTPAPTPGPSTPGPSTPAPTPGPATPAPSTPAPGPAPVLVVPTPPGSPPIAGGPAPGSNPAPAKVKLKVDRILLIAAAIFVAYKVYDYYRTTGRLERLAALELDEMPERAPEPLIP